MPRLRACPARTQARVPLGRLATGDFRTSAALAPLPPAAALAARAVQTRESWRCSGTELLARRPLGPVPNCDLARQPGARLLRHLSPRREASARNRWPSPTL